MPDIAQVAGAGGAAAFLAALLAGLGTALTPCVYPMIPITISVFGAKGVARGRAVALATTYVAGIAAMFGTLGTTFALLGRTFGTFLASPWFVVPLAIFFTLMAVSMFGAFDLALPSGLQQRLSGVGGKGFGGAFLMGVVGGVIAAPCTGPPLASILAYVATTRNAFTGFFLLATYAVGIGVPFWAIAGFSMSMPRSGRWMEAVKSVFGIALLVMALYYLKNVLPALGRLTSKEAGFAAGMTALAAVGIAIGAVHLSFHDAWKVRLRKAAGVAMVVVAAHGIANFMLTPKGDIVLDWKHDEPAALADARARQRPIFVDFMADWCLPCKEMEIQMFSRPEVASEMQRFTLLKMDCSDDENADVQAVKKKYGVAGSADILPAIRIVSPDGRVLAAPAEPSKLAPAEFLELLRRARG